MKVKQNKEKTITDMIILLEKGIGYSECFRQIKTNLDISRASFSNYWKVATERHALTQQATQTAIAEVYIESNKERFKKAILSKEQRMEILTSIALGEIPLTKHIVCDGVIQEVEVVPNWMDRKSAISELNKMDGSYAATKTDLNIKGFVLPDTDEAMEQRIKELLEKANK